jgi:hypothetical protein
MLNAALLNIKAAMLPIPTRLCFGEKNKQLKLLRTDARPVPTRKAVEEHTKNKQIFL